MLKKNDTITLGITDMTNLGVGVAHDDESGKTVFVQGGVTGDIASVLIIKVTSSYCVGRIVELIEPSEHRIVPDCPVSKRCGGCSFCHITYEYELEIKRRYIESCLRKNRLEDNIVPPVLTNGHREGYRNKVQYPVGKNGIGYYAGRSHDIIVGSSPCPLHDPVFDPILKVIESFIKEEKTEPYDEKSGKGILRHIYLRTSSGQGCEKKVSVCLVINADGLKGSEKLVERLKENPSVGGITLNINKKNTNVILGDRYKQLWGSGYITDRLCGLTFDISPAAFCQVNHDTAELLYKTALSLAEIKPHYTIADLFCGTGTIGLIFKKLSGAKKLIGIEIVPEAVRNARSNAKKNAVDNAVFIAADANEPALSEADVIILDPPRKGLDISLIRRIGELKPKQVIYISCDPATLARDLRLFRDVGYHTDSVQGIDMFPMTSHVETVVLMSRVDK